MRAHALPLQLLLILALVLNGIAGAMAGVPAPIRDLPATSVAAVDNAATPPGDCGTHHREASAAAAIAQPSTGCHAGDDSDCGNSPQCLQACMYAAVAIAPQPFVSVLQPRADAILHPLASGHPAPPLPNPIRPPIA